MSRFYKSDKSGVDLVGDNHKILVMTIIMDSSYIDEPIKLTRQWDLTTAEYQALVADAVTMKNAVEAAGAAFVAAVEG